MNNPLGTIINNTAAIYFDFNEPIFTNTTFHEIGEDFIPETLITIFQNASDNSDEQIQIYPNPFSDFCTIDIPDAYIAEGHVQFNLYNSTGQKVLDLKTKSTKLQIPARGLSSGIYFYTLNGLEKQFNSGKLIVK